MNGPCREILAGSRFTRYQNGALGGTGPMYPLHNALHDRRGTDETITGAVGGEGDIFYLLILLAGVDQLHELLKKVFGLGNGLNSVLVAKPARADHFKKRHDGLRFLYDRQGRIWKMFLPLLDDIQSGDISRDHPGHHAVNPLLHKIQRLLDRISGFDVISGLRENLLEGRSLCWIVLDYQNLVLIGAHHVEVS